MHTYISNNQTIQDMRLKLNNFVSSIERVPLFDNLLFYFHINGIALEILKEEACDKINRTNNQ